MSIKDNSIVTVMFANLTVETSWYNSSFMSKTSSKIMFRLKPHEYLSTVMAFSHLCFCSVPVKCCELSIFGTTGNV